MMNSQVVQQWVICQKNLSNYAMWPSNRHLQTKHPGHKHKTLAFFKPKKTKKIKNCK